MDKVRDIDAKQNLDTLLDRVEKGEEITITRDGRPVARLLHAELQFDRAAAKAAAARILERSKGMSLGDLKIKNLIHEGHEY